MKTNIKVNSMEIKKNIIPKLKDSNKSLNDVYNTSNALKVPEQFIYKNEFNELVKTMDINRKSSNEIISRIENTIKEFDELTETVSNNINSINKMFISKIFFKN